MLGGRHSLGTALSSKGQTEDTHIKVFGNLGLPPCPRIEHERAAALLLL